MTLLDPVSDRLLKATARQSYDPDVDVDWDAPPVEGLWWMQPERTSLYGTPTWDRLSTEQQMELARHEVASVVSVGLWFEIVLMQILLRDAYNGDPRASKVQWALTEVGDETRHSVMFGKALAALGMPRYGPRPEAFRIGRLGQHTLRGASAYAGILIGEEPVDRWQRDLMKDERIQPMARMIARIHVVEEARHVTFAREELAASTRGLGRTALAWHQLLTAQIAYVTMRSLVNPQVYAAVGLDPHETRKVALGNEHYRGTIAWMGEKIMPFLEEQGLVGRAHRKTWKASFLLP